MGTPIRSVEEEGGEMFYGLMQNYFSIGIDAKVTHAVQTARSDTKCGKCCFGCGCGKICYAVQGMSRALIGNDLTQSLQLLRTDNLDLQPPLPERRINGRRGRVRQLMFVNI